MGPQGIAIVTGAFGYSGRWIAQRLLDRGCKVRTLTNSPRPGEPLRRCGWQSSRSASSDPPRLADSLAGAPRRSTTRIGCGSITAISPLLTSIRFALGFCLMRHASPGSSGSFMSALRIPALDWPLEYFRGKAEVEDMLRGQRDLATPSWRPAVLFGPRPEDSILINNIAWMLRRLPVIGCFGSGDYRLQPIHVEDLADLAVALGGRVETT